VKRFRTVDIVAMAFLGIAVGLASRWFAEGSPGTFADQWLPNLAVEALSIAATILIVDRIVQREAQERIRPRLLDAYGQIVDPVASFLTSFAMKDPEFMEALRAAWGDRQWGPVVPAPDFPSFNKYVDRWISRPSMGSRAMPLFSEQALRAMTRAMTDRLLPIVGLDRDILPPDIVSSIRTVARRVESDAIEQRELFSLGFDVYLLLGALRLDEELWRYIRAAVLTNPALVLPARRPLLKTTPPRVRTTQRATRKGRAPRG
jgi:hypothetical protein